MTNRIRTTPALFCSAAGLAAFHGQLDYASAQELYRQNPVNSFGGPSSQDARNPGGLGWFSEVVDNFQGQGGWTIGGLEFWGGYADPTPGNTEGFMIRFYEDAAGEVGPLLLAQDVMTFTREVYYTHPTLNFDGFRYTLTLNQPFVVPATGQYWMSVVAILPRGGSAVEPQWGWIGAVSINQPPAKQWFFSPGNFMPLTQDTAFVLHGPPEPPCYANCDGSTTPPILNVEDFTCFINEFAAASQLPHEQQLTHYANCDQSTTAPVLNVEDFTCFINKFAQGCR
jgi:hypothetical protein